MHDCHLILHCIERGDAIGAHAAMTNHLVHVELTLLQKQLGMSQKKPDKKPNGRKKNEVACVLSREGQECKKPNHELLDWFPCARSSSSQSG